LISKPQKNIGYVDDEKDISDPVYDKREEEDPEMLEKALIFAYAWAWALTAFLIFIIPLPMLGERYVFSSGFFTAWVIVGFTWTWFAAITVILYPIWEAKDGIIAIITGKSIAAPAPPTFTEA